MLWYVDAGWISQDTNRPVLETRRVEGLGTVDNLRLASGACRDMVAAEDQDIC